MDLIYLLIGILIGGIILSMIASILQLYKMHLEKKYEKALMIDNEPMPWNRKPRDWEYYDSEK